MNTDMEGENIETKQPSKSEVAKSLSAEALQEASKPLTDEEKAERLKRAEERIKQRRLEMQEEERKRDLEREKARRREGQDITKIKAEMEWREAQKIAEQKKREKQEDRIARQRILEEIARDRANMKAKTSGAPSPNADIKSNDNNASQSKQCSSSDQKHVKKDYNETRLQIRLPDNTRLIQSFGVNEPLSAVRVYIDMNCNGQLGPYIDLSTPYPRKTFSDDEMQMSLSTLGLVPSSVILATKSKTPSSAI